MDGTPGADDIAVLRRTKTMPVRSLAHAEVVFAFQDTYVKVARADKAVAARLMVFMMKTRIAAFGNSGKLCNEV